VGFFDVRSDCGDSFVVFVGCGKKKRSGIHQVEFLYTGTYFCSCLRLARRIAGDDHIFVLSAKYGVLSLIDVVKSYDVSLASMSKWEVWEWRNRVRRVIQNWTRKGYQPVFVCSSLYHRGFCGIKPLSGVGGIGKQLAFIKKELVKERLEMMAYPHEFLGD